MDGETSGSGAEARATRSASQGDGREGSPGRYLCLVYADEAAFDAMPAAELRALEEECVARDAALRRSGRCIASERLATAETATTLRVRGGRPVITDGPFIEAREQLGGFYLIEARDLSDAIRTASGIPTARLGAIEIRPVRVLELS